MTNELKDRITKIHNGEVPEGYLKTACGIIPEEWKSVSLSNISDEITEKVGDREYETLSISAGIGFVNQACKFGKELSGKQYEKYTVLRKNDFSYNKGNSKKYPQGCIYKLNDRDEAAVPNVFESFRLKVGVPEYYEQVFFFGFLNRQLAAKINHGVRDDGLLNLTGNDFYSCEVPLPPLPEQQKIAEILSMQDKVIELIRKQIEELQKLKKAYLQKMFPKKGCAYPEIRFKGFTDAWEQRELNYYLSVSKAKNKDERYSKDDVLSVSGDYGIVNQIAFQGRSFAGESVANYGVVETGDVVYTKSPLKSNPYGIIKTNKGIAGIVSTLYAVYKPHITVCSDFVQVYFEQDVRMNNYMQPLVNKGAKNDMKVSAENALKGKVIFPSVKEQQRICTYFNSLDHLITLHQRKLEQEQQKKKALMQLLLTGIVRVKL